MGTRNLTMVQMNGEIKVAQYGQWDGYPSCSGIKILKFLRCARLDTFKKALSNVRWITNEMQNEMWKEAGAKDEELKSGFVPMHISELFTKFHPELSRDTGAEILWHVLTSDKDLYLKNDLEFAKNSLFCEWAYLVNLDDNTLECYKGFNQVPLAESDRFYFDGHKDDKYYPIRLIKTYNIDNLPSDEEFLNDLEPRNDEEDEEE